MILVLAVTIGVLFAAGTHLVQQRTLTRVVIGFALLAHGVNLLLIAAGGKPGDAPIIGDDGLRDWSDPLPQAFALTAIVISFGISAFLLALAYRSYVLTRDDDVQDDVEDRRIARLARRRRQEERGP